MTMNQNPQENTSGKDAVGELHRETPLSVVQEVRLVILVQAQPIPTITVRSNFFVTTNWVTAHNFLQLWWSKNPNQ